MSRSSGSQWPAPALLIRMSGVLAWASATMRSAVVDNAPRRCRDRRCRRAPRRPPAADVGRDLGQPLGVARQQDHARGRPSKPSRRAVASPMPLEAPEMTDNVPATFMVYPLPGYPPAHAHAAVQIRRTSLALTTRRRAPRALSKTRFTGPSA